MSLLHYQTKLSLKTLLPEKTPPNYPRILAKSSPSIRFLRRCIPLRNFESDSSFILVTMNEMIKGDKLVLRGLMFHGYHGVKPEERKLGQKFLVDVDAWMDLLAAGNSHSLSDTVSYTDIYCIVKAVVEGAPHNLLESVAQLIATTVLGKFPQVSAFRVQVGKPHVAVIGPIDYLGVEIIRHRTATEQS